MTLRDRIRSKQSLLGTLVSIPSTETVEILIQAGFDWLFLDLEHSAMTARDTQTILQVASERIGCLVRTESRDELAIRKALDSGAHGVIVPQINSADEARQVVSFAKYPPIGTRGAGLGRAQGYGLNFREYTEHANETLAVVIQIEHIDGVRNIGEILKVPGIDAVFIGPYDLSGSLGKLGLLDDPEVAEAITQTLSACSAHDIPRGAFAASAETARTFINAGVTLLAVGSDALFLGTAARGELESARALVGLSGREPK